MDDDLDNLTDDDDRDSSQFRELRRQREELAAQNKELSQRVRKAEMRAAAADITGLKNDGPTKFFLEHYDGDADAESLKAALAENGFLEAPAPNVPDQELAQHQAISDAQTAGQPTGVNEDGYYEELRKLYEEASPNADPHVLSDKANEIMRKYGQRVVTDQGVR